MAVRGGRDTKSLRGMISRKLYYLTQSRLQHYNTDVASS